MRYVELRKSGTEREVQIGTQELWKLKCGSQENQERSRKCGTQEIRNGKRGSNRDTGTLEIEMWKSGNQERSRKCGTQEIRNGIHPCFFSGDSFRRSRPFLIS